MIPRLVEEEANRVIALALVVLLLVAVPIVARAFEEPRLTPYPMCTEGAHRDARGRVVCGVGSGPLLSPSEALLLGTKIDVNRARAEDLEIVPGIGEKLALRIIADRDANGPFASVDDVARVKGIGPKILEKMRPYLRATGPPTWTSDPR